MPTFWWDTSKPGRGTASYSDAVPPKNSDDSSGVVGQHRDILFVCERSGFLVPYDETVIDPLTGRRVWKRFVDPEPAQP